MPYIELHTHTNFSFLDGAVDPESLVNRAVELGYPALAITDTNGLYGIVRFNQQARQTGLRPIFGATALLTTNHRLVLLARDATGYANLSRMLSAAQLNSPKGEARVTTDLLAAHADGLIALAHDDLADCLLRHNRPAAERLLCDYRDLFGCDNLYIELRHHHLPAHEFLCEELTRIGRHLNLPTVATNDVHYAVPDGRRLQDVLTCIRHHTTLDNAGALLYPNAERCLKSPAAMARLFRHYPDAVANTVAIADRCWFSLEQLETSLPDFTVPDTYTEQSYLEHLTWIGARNRYGDLSDKHRRQLEHELRIIGRLKLAGYFLIVWDIARYCTDHGILSQGRGSAANSAVCYCLGITAVDPIKLDLLFERFISEERHEPPDIDIDIANNRREEVIQYVYNKYGRTHAAMVCEVISYRGRSSVRDIGKVLGFSVTEVNRLSKLLGSWAHPDEVEARLGETGLNLDDRRVRLLLDLVKQIYRFPRHLGIHVGGMIITRKPLAGVVPIENATMPDRSVIQWDKDDVGAANLVKIDLLGLGMLTLIDLALKLVQKHRGVTIDPARLTYDDPRVFELLCNADTVGVFQVESRAQMNALPRHRPTCFYDLVVEVALIRPGPIQGDMVHPYLRRRNGEEPVTYPHPCLEPILKRTLGIPLFQEQGMKVAVAAAGFTASQADELRRAMGHKRSRERMEALSHRLIEGMERNGIPHDAAQRIFDQLAAFADFGFAESHAASFALLVYVSAFLKVYYPEEFYCSLLNAQPMGFYSPSSIVYEAQRRGVTILPVDITKSSFDCTVECVSDMDRVVDPAVDRVVDRVDVGRVPRERSSRETRLDKSDVETLSTPQLAVGSLGRTSNVERVGQESPDSCHGLQPTPGYCHCEERSDETISSLPVGQEPQGSCHCHPERSRRVTSPLVGQDLYGPDIDPNQKPGYRHCEERSVEAISPRWPTIYGGSGRSGSEGLQPRETRLAEIDVAGRPQLAVGSLDERVGQEPQGSCHCHPERSRRVTSPLVGQDPCGPDIDLNQRQETVIPAKAGIQSSSSSHGHSPSVRASRSGSEPRSDEKPDTATLEEGSRRSGSLEPDLFTPNLNLSGHNRSNLLSSVGQDLYGPDIASTPTHSNCHCERSEAISPRRSGSEPRSGEKPDTSIYPVGQIPFATLPPQTDPNAIAASLATPPAQRDLTSDLTPPSVRLGFRTVRHIGETSRETIETELARAPFTSIKDFVRRTRLAPQPLAQLALIGAFDSFGYHRRQALWIVLGLSRREGELDLSTEETGHTMLDPMHIGEQIVADYKGMDLSTGPHPVSLIRASLTQRGILSSADLRTQRNMSWVTTAGVVVIRQRPATAKGFMFITMEDETGFSNVVVKPDMLAAHRRTLVHNQALIVKGILERKDGVTNVIGKQFSALEIDQQDIVFKSRDFR